MIISAVVNTHNEEQNLRRCLSSVQPFVNDIVVVDMHSHDRTVEVAREFTDRIWQHEYVGFVEPARNFAISKADCDWILLIDADEVMPESLGAKLSELADSASYSYVRTPRKNIIFNKWLKASGWWPDYQIRLFEKNAVSWGDEIHSLPITTGKGRDLPAVEDNALIHYHYTSISEYIGRLNRYTTIEARQLQKDGRKFEWRNLLVSPANEFLTRFFAWEGYKDGLHGLALSMLQAVSFLVVQLKLWEQTKFATYNEPGFLNRTYSLLKKTYHDMCYWYYLKLSEPATGVTQIIYKIRSRLRL